MRYPRLYDSVESRVFDAILLPSAASPSHSEDPEVPFEAWEALRGWTQNMYLTFREEPGRIMKKLHEDDAYPLGMTMAAYGKPALRGQMRRVLQATDELLHCVWAAAKNGALEGDGLRPGPGFALRPKQAELLLHTGLEYADGVFRAPAFREMFRALQSLTKLSDGFMRFARCYYDAECAGLAGLFRAFSQAEPEFDRLIAWMSANGFGYRAELRSSPVQRLEACRVSYMKNMDGRHTPGDRFDHAHIGFSAEFNALNFPPVFYALTIQKPKELLADFDAMPAAVQKFVVEHHARCTGCGYCIQMCREKDAKLCTAAIVYNGRRYGLCPVLNYVYTYCWAALSETLVDGLIAYLGYMDKKFYAR